MQLAIGVLASIVLMHIVRIKLEAPSNREQAAHVDFCSAPFFILALVVHLYARVWGWVSVLLVVSLLQTCYDSAT